MDFMANLMKMEKLKLDGVKTLKADCLIDNLASIRILEKIGLKEVYRNDDYIFWKSNIEDLLV